MGLEFYQQMPSLQRFEALTERTKFQPLPADWSIVLTDIQGSTKAIEAGRYKDVNLIGAAAITAVANALRTRDFPFVFGGDGATLLLPNELIEIATASLQRLQRHARDRFGFSLRVGVVPISTVLDRGGRVFVARFQVSPGASLAMFQGGGVQLAEKIIKQDVDKQRYLIAPPSDQEPPALESLSCRWAPIPNRNGAVISVLIQAIHADRAHEIYGKILAELHPIFLEDKFRPISAGTLRPEGFFANFRREWALRKDLDWRGIIWKILVPMIYTRIGLLLPLSAVGKKMGAYIQGTVANSDYKKLDDCLRMVLDCSPAQADWLRSILQSHFERGEIYYGIHQSPAALMTCMMEGMEPHQHIHFIDGADGGYAMAAKAMKQQMKTE